MGFSFRKWLILWSQIFPEHAFNIINGEQSIVRATQNANISGT